jgi:SNF2 family DNA or RNA helicase
MPNITLRQHQLKSMKKIFGGWNAIYDGSQPGCGKSATAMETAWRTGLLTLIICPAFLRCNWLRECETFYPELNAQIFDAKFVCRPGTRVIIMSYEAMEKAKKLFKAAQLYVWDEAHFAANPQTKRAKLMLEYIRTHKPKRVLLMSGTILKNRVPDLYIPLKVLDLINQRGFNERYKTYHEFCRRFTDERITKVAGFLKKEYVGIKNEDELRDWLKPVYFRNKLDDIAELPSLVFASVELEGGSSRLDADLQREWDAYRGGIVEDEDDILGEDTPLVGEHISSAKARSALEKVPSVVSFGDDLLSCGAGPIVVFSDHRASALELAEGFKGSGWRVGLIRGGMTDKSRDVLAQAFQAGELDVLVGTLGAMSVGLTLTRAAIALICDKSWSPATNAQAYKRIHRMGQKNKCLIYLFSRGSIDENINKNLAEKERVCGVVFEGM